MTKAQALQVAEQHIRAAFQALRDGGLNPANALEHMQALLMQVWYHSVGLITHVLMHFM